jgi:small nuclear ribonucleoprotein (snRNP)-like protein
MTGNVVISEVDAHMNVVLGKTEKHVPYGELDGTTECVEGRVAQSV